MKVRDLIEELRRFDPDDRVGVEVEEACGQCTETGDREIEEVSVVGWPSKVKVVLRTKEVLWVT